MCTVVIYMGHHSNFGPVGSVEVLQQGLEHRKAQPRREHLAPRDETHGSCHDLALHGYGAGITARRCTCSLSKNRPVAHQALRLQYCDSCIDGDHVSMLRCGAGRGELNGSCQRSVHGPCARPSSVWHAPCGRSRGLSASKIWTHLRRVGEVFGGESG